MNAYLLCFPSNSLKYLVRTLKMTHGVSLFQLHEIRK